MKWVNCNAPSDILLVDDWNVVKFINSVPAPCGHSHLIIVGRLQFVPVEQADKIIGEQQL